MRCSLFQLKLISKNTWLIILRLPLIKIVTEAGTSKQEPAFVNISILIRVHRVKRVKYKENYIFRV